MRVICLFLLSSRESRVCSTFYSPCLIPVAYKALVFGDWGQERTSSSRPAQELTARAMGKYLEDNPDVEYIVTTGDNFYGDPPNSPDSERFDSSWREVYWLPEYPVMTSLDWYLAVGNHDHTDSFAELSQVSHFSHDHCITYAQPVPALLQDHSSRCRQNV